jgi:hypothetical protein
MVFLRIRGNPYETGDYIMGILEVSKKQERLYNGYIGKFQG